MSNNRQATATGTTQASREVAGLSVAVPPRSGLPALPFNAAIPANTDGTAVNQTATSGEHVQKRAAPKEHDALPLKMTRLRNELHDKLSEVLISVAGMFEGYFAQLQAHS